MPPRFSTFANNVESSQTTTELLATKETSDTSDNITQFKESKNPKIILVWKNIILFAYLHLAAIYGAYLFFTKAKWATVFFSVFLYSIGVLGITAGAHRLWSHRSYKAKWPLRLILIIFNTIAFEDDVYHWVRDHRLHHKYSETDADPHNNTRGFFYAHIGWLLCRKHPEVLAKGKKLDLSDLKADPIVMFQRKYIKAAENPIVSAFAFGEGWHNYHHVFPWDYKTAEWGNYSMNLTTAFIDFFAKIGWAYDLKSPTAESLEKRIKRTGDGSHKLWGYSNQNISH